MELLQVDIDEMKEHLQTLESEIEEFRPFVESGFADEITMVQAMRSDFTPALEDVLKNISDKDAVRLLETLEKYKNAAMGINTDPCIKYAIKAKSNLIHFVLMDNANKHKAMATPFRITLFV